MVRTLLRKAAYGSRIYLCGSLVRTLLRKVATPPHLSLRFTGQNFAPQSGYATASWSKHFATQNGLRPPRFLRGAYFAVHWSELCFAKWLHHRIYLCGSLVRTLLCKVATPPHHIQNFASQSGLRLPHLSLRFTGQSILLRKTVYCQNFATQNRLQRQRSSLFLTAPFFFGVHTLRFIKGLT